MNREGKGSDFVISTLNDWTDSVQDQIIVAWVNPSDKGFNLALAH